jgi:hypothetical protein
MDKIVWKILDFNHSKKFNSRECAGQGLTTKVAVLSKSSDLL